MPGVCGYQAPGMFLTFKYKLQPKQKQHMVLLAELTRQRHLYNAGLEERIGAYRKIGKSLTYKDQFKSLTEWRHIDEEAGQTPSNLQRWTLKRLDEAMLSFFRRLRQKAGKAGFPRFRGASRWSSFGFMEFSGIRFDGKRLHWRTMPGGLRVHMHRPLPAGGRIKSCIFTKSVSGWSVCFQVDIPDVATVALEQVRNPIGLDVGLSAFATSDSGWAIHNPRLGGAAQADTARCQRALARCKRGSKRRVKVRRKLTKQQAKLANQRRTWLHQQATKVVKEHDLIAVEDLNIRGMVRNPTLARSIHDAGWGIFLGMLCYKAARAGAQFHSIDPRGTSQRCSECGIRVQKSLRDRVHDCPSCGLYLDRDVNAARNILQAVAGLGAVNGLKKTRWLRKTPASIGSPGHTAPENLAGNCDSGFIIRRVA